MVTWRYHNNYGCMYLCHVVLYGVHPSHCLFGAICMKASLLHYALYGFVL